MYYSYYLDVKNSNVWSVAKSFPFSITDGKYLFVIDVISDKDSAVSVLGCVRDRYLQTTVLQTDSSWFYVPLKDFPYSYDYGS